MATLVLLARPNSLADGTLAVSLPQEVCGIVWCQGEFKVILGEWQSGHGMLTGSAGQATEYGFLQTEAPGALLLQCSSEPSAAALPG